jgi:hypothetical protein
MVYVGDGLVAVVGKAPADEPTPARARVIALMRRSSRPLGMPDAFDRAPLR